MYTCNKPLTKRERRRRQNEEKLESKFGEQFKLAAEITSEKQKNFRGLAEGNIFEVSKTEAAFQSCISVDEKSTGKCVRDNNYMVQTDLVLESDSDGSKCLTHTINEGTNSNSDSKNLTFSLCAADVDDDDDDDDDKSISKHDTYSIQTRKTDLARPIPAPRKCHSAVLREIDKQSSDTDRDVLEIEIDDVRGENGRNSDELPTGDFDEGSMARPEVPKPKPRKLSSGSVIRNSSSDPCPISKSGSRDNVTVPKTSSASATSNPEAKSQSPARWEPREEAESEDSPVLQERGKKRGGLFGLVQQKKKSSRGLSSAAKLEKARIPTISSILRDLKSEGPKSKLEDECRREFDLDSPHLPHSQQNDNMYVQRKNGFCLRNREDVLRKDEELVSKAQAGMEDSTTSKMLRTAMLFQEYWSKSMVYFHGVLAGFGFFHAFTIFSVMFYFNYEFQGFVNIYTFLALKIHYIFYTLIALCIISCLDRLDIGHLKMKHWSHVCVKCPSLWLIFSMYFVSFVLTFVNHTTEFRFDGHRYENRTEEMPWDRETQNNISEAFSSWYRLVWARDMIVLAAWLLISLTEFEDNLYLYVVQLSKNLDGNKDGSDGIVLAVNS